MGLVKKTKEERQEAAKENRDTPLAKTPEAITPISDVKSAIADIEKRSLARQKSIDESTSKRNAARIERSKNKTKQSGSKLQGLTSLSNTLGMQYTNKN